MKEPDPDLGSLGEALKKAAENKPDSPLAQIVTDPEKILSDLKADITKLGKDWVNLRFFDRESTPIDTMRLTWQNLLPHLVIRNQDERQSLLEAFVSGIGFVDRRERDVRAITKHHSSCGEQVKNLEIFADGVNRNDVKSVDRVPFVILEAFIDLSGYSQDNPNALALHLQNFLAQPEAKELIDSTGTVTKATLISTLAKWFDAAKKDDVF